MKDLSIPRSKLRKQSFRGLVGVILLLAVVAITAQEKKKNQIETTAIPIDFQKSKSRSNQVCSVFYYNPPVPKDDMMWPYWEQLTFPEVVRQRVMSGMPQLLRKSFDTYRLWFCVRTNDDRVTTHVTEDGATALSVQNVGYNVEHKILRDFMANGRQIAWCEFEITVKLTDGNKTKFRVPYELRLRPKAGRVEGSGLISEASLFKGEVEWGEVTVVDDL